MEKGSKPPGMLENAKKYARLASAALAFGALEPGCNPNESQAQSSKTGIEAKMTGETDIEKTIQQLESLPKFETNHVFFDNNPDYFTPIPNGEFSKEEQLKRTKRLPYGELIFEDIGLNFYYVSSGDSIQKIKNNLTKYPEFEYLNNQNRKVISFNIQNNELLASTWIPVPLENKNRYVTNEQFAEYTKQAVIELLNDPKYAAEVQKLLETIPFKQLVASIIAVAKQESAPSQNAPIGTFGYQRYEKKYKVFSYGPMHILMTGAGLQARKHLNMSEGQALHPKNAVKLFLCFMIEKSNGKPEKYFPLNTHSEEMAKFFNGAHWRQINPNYAVNLSEYYLATLDEL